jgi:hypothetical protein
LCSPGVFETGGDFVGCVVGCDIVLVRMGVVVVPCATIVGRCASFVVYSAGLSKDPQWCSPPGSEIFGVDTFGPGLVASGTVTPSSSSKDLYDHTQINTGAHSDPERLSG